jgi:3',5'-cyclic AMP phosphodiesterase CpdA
MPDAFYAVQYVLQDGTSVQLIGLDTETLQEDESVSERQLDWLEEVLRRSDSDWKIVFGHHPLYSEGSHGGSDKLVGLLKPLFMKYGVHLYLAGHDHSQQVLEAPWDGFALVSGAGAKSSATGTGADTLFATSRKGFMVLKIDGAAIWIDVVSEGGLVEYSLELTAA